jgi:HD-GYP domain-containing protein (c-di-GMP phosphodiesterase class II)
MTIDSTASPGIGLPNRLFEGKATLDERLQGLHRQLIDTVSCVDRIACAIYDQPEDLLKTFINSTRSGESITAYQFKLSDSVSLSHLAKSGEFRVIVDIPASLAPNTAHSAWVIKQGYQSSFTVPMYDNGAFMGFIFFDSLQQGAFTSTVQRDLGLYCTLINMAISNELAAVRAVVASAHVARDFTDLRDFETGAHLERMARYSRVIGCAIAPVYGLSDEFVEHLYIYAPLHDIGKIGIPDKVLLKPGKLDPEERKLMETHVEKGREVLKKILGDFGIDHLPDSLVMMNIVGCHHEFMDGSGYPAGLKGDAVPVEARIVMVADIFDALTSKRPYKAAWTVEEALAELDRMTAAGKLDGNCVAAIKSHAAEMGEIGRRYQDIHPA